MSGFDARLAILAERERVAWDEYLAALRARLAVRYEDVERLAWHRLASERADIARLRRAVEFERDRALVGTRS